jgi:hypothetical protein
VSIVGVAVIVVAILGRAGSADLLALVRRSAVILREFPLILFFLGTLLAVEPCSRCFTSSRSWITTCWNTAYRAGSSCAIGRSLTCAIVSMRSAGSTTSDYTASPSPCCSHWEDLVSPGRGVHDAWVRSLTIWYAWLLIALLWSVLRKRDQWLPVWAVGALLSTLGFLFMLAIYHLDAWRIFLFTVSIWLLSEGLKGSSRALMLLLGAVCGAHAFLHSLGMILFAPMVLVLFLFGQGSWTVRVRNVSRDRHRLPDGRRCALRDRHRLGHGLDLQGHRLVLTCVPPKP